MYAGKQWHPPGHWTKETRDAHQRSMDLLHSITDGANFMERIVGYHGLDRILIKGKSRRTYLIETRPHYETQYEDEMGIFDELTWRFSITAGARKKDVMTMNKYSVSLCIHPDGRHRLLPVGDQIAALALSLSNDTTTAMRIPLLAQFLVSSRDVLENVCQFSEDGVIYDEYHDGEYDDESDDEWMVEELELLEEPIMNIHQLYAQAYHLDVNEFETQDSIEDRAFERWSEELEDDALQGNTASPWHHNEERVWKLEERLLSGRK